MKSEERHELQKNELTKVAGQATAFYDRYQNQILWGLVVVLLAMAAWIYIARSSRVAAESAWTTLQNAAGTPKDYVDVAIVHPNTEVANVARLQAAAAWLDQGVKAGFSNREEANSYLKDARKEFEELLAVTNLDKDLREQALYGMAQTLESISGADTEAAVKAYEALLKEFPDSIYKEHAEGRIKDLKNPATQEFLAWYQKQNPKPPEREKPKDGEAPGANSAAPKPGTDPFGLGLPAPPQPGGTETPPAESPMDTEKNEPQSKADPVEPTGPALPVESPPASEEKPAEEKPADEKPAEEQKTDSAPPAEQK